MAAQQILQPAPAEAAAAFRPCWARCHCEATHSFSDKRTTNLATPGLKSLSWQHIHRHFLCTSFFFLFVCCLFILSHSPKVPDGNQNLLALFKEYCGSPERAQKTPEKWQHHTMTNKISRVSYQLVYTRMSHQSYWKISTIHCQQQCLQLGQPPVKYPCGYLWLWFALK